MNRRTLGLIARPGMIVFVVCTALYVTACGGKSTPPPPAAAAPQQQFHLEGKIVSIDRKHQQFEVDHKEIPGFMGAMTMPYPVKIATDMDKFGVGDEIKADLVLSEGQYQLENIVVVKKADSKAAPSSGAQPPGR